MAEISRHLANELVSIESMIQRGRAPGEPVAIVMITHEAQHVAVVRALAGNCRLRPRRRIALHDSHGNSLTAGLRAF